MNPNDFEQKLRRQSPRPIPVEWRSQILDACVQQETVTVETAVPAWRLFFTRFPVAWSAFAALWIVLIAINGVLARSDTPEMPGQSAAGPVQLLIVWNHYSATLQQLAGDEPSVDSETPAPSAPLKSNRPRSERRLDWQLGEIPREPTLMA